MDDGVRVHRIRTCRDHRHTVPPAELMVALVLVGWLSGPDRASLLPALLGTALGSGVHPHSSAKEQACQRILVGLLPRPDRRPHRCSVQSGTTSRSPRTDVGDLYPLQCRAEHPDGGQELRVLAVPPENRCSGGSHRGQATQGSGHMPVMQSQVDRDHDAGPSDVQMPEMWCARTHAVAG